MKHVVQTYDLSLLEKSQQAWERSAALRVYYKSVWEAVLPLLKEGDTLELGSGIGKASTIIPQLTTSDIEKTPWVDRACSAYDIEGTGRQWDNVFAMDVLHHLTRPLDFFVSAAASLMPDGKVILVEPAATPFGQLFYRFFHHEPIKPDQLDPPFEYEGDAATGEFANMGMGIALICRHHAWTIGQLQSMGLELETLFFRDVMAYPLTGGFSKPALCSAWLISTLLRLENFIPQSILRGLGLRMVIVLRKV